MSVCGNNGTPDGHVRGLADLIKCEKSDWLELASAKSSRSTMLEKDVDAARTVSLSVDTFSIPNSLINKLSTDFNIDYVPGDGNLVRLMDKLIYLLGYT